MHLNKQGCYCAATVQARDEFQKHIGSVWNWEVNCGPSGSEWRTVRRTTDWKTTFCEVSGGFDVQVTDRPPGSSGPSAKTQRRTGEAASDKSGHGFGRGLFLKTSRSVQDSFQGMDLMGTDIWKIQTNNGEEIQNKTLEKRG